MRGHHRIRAFLQSLGIEHPVLLSPMAGGAGTPELVAEVSNVGGLGAWGGAYASPEQILQAAKTIRALTDRPFGINLFAGGYASQSSVDPAPMLAVMRAVHDELGLPSPVLPSLPASPFAEQLDAVIEARPANFSFTFGIPDAQALARLRKADIVTGGTATHVDEARALEDAGVDYIVAQGEEAGAHRGTFLKSFDEAMVPMRTLVREIAAAVNIPVVASGGIMDGNDIAETLQLGAVAAQLGTAFLPCPECGTPDVHKRLILEARDDTTMITRVFSGRHARGMRNDFIDRVPPDTILPFRQQNDLTRPMRVAAGAQGKAGYLSLWAGRGVTRARAMPAGELVHTLVAEIAGA
ncbi:MAG: nitronate monooxygenase [Pseudorhodoplanes sp.]|nr:hypothetical protein [Pseudorhodoplanes sp.]MBW7950121.1 nitronate monooxygenase [Pseudorhodoplanes sp.]MCL4710486.1 nitronate monooxygenase [Pseudorhodoplanes sp.]MCQ3942570.1 nitronate monooxygenase [Alphaproteobacteria bacterium]GIK81559.1 MAG: oxidoreductase [Alphaproteobacteria bacterium]